MTEKKKFKFESWMLGALIIPVGIGLSIYGSMKAHTVDPGGECSDNDECKEPADSCLSIGSKSVCTMQCGSCPAGLQCVTMNVTLQNSAGFHDTAGAYCLPPDLAQTVAAPGG